MSDEPSGADLMTVVLEAEIYVDYSQTYVTGAEGEWLPDMDQSFRGQSNGLCGAGKPGGLMLSVAPQYGDVPFRVETGTTRPPVPGGYRDVVEVSLDVAAPEMLLDPVEASQSPFTLPAAGSYRVRYCAWDYEAGLDAVDRSRGEPAVDHYLLQFWPAPPKPDEVLRCSGPATQSLHDYARAIAPPPPPPTPEEAAAAAKARAAESIERRRLDHLYNTWGWPMPSERIQQVGERAAALWRTDPELLVRLEHLAPAEQRRQAARQACRAPQLDDRPEVQAALVALSAGQPVPQPFTGHVEAKFWLAYDRGATGGIGVGYIGDPSPPLEADAGQRAVAALVCASGADPFGALLDALGYAIGGDGSAPIVSALTARLVTDDTRPG